jgi:release factor glutamine methyltransferase
VNTDQLLKSAKKTLVAANERFGWQGDEEDQAWDILAHVLGRDPDRDADLQPATVKRFERLLKQRLTGEPLAYILGWVDFLDFKMTVKNGAFIPRLTSEWLAKQAIKRLRNRAHPVHVDLATGIGPVPIGVARAVPKAEVYGVDISKKAVKLAAENAKKLGARNARFFSGDMFTPLPKRLRGSIDVITIHPPYVPAGEVDDLPLEIKKFEETHTLTDGSHDGLGLVRRVVNEGREWLGPNGWVLIEIVPSEWNRVRPIFKEAGYTDIRSTYGELKLTRVICGRLPGGS